MDEEDLHKAIEALAREVLITSLNMQTEGKQGYALIRVSSEKIRHLWETLNDEQLGEMSTEMIASLAVRGLMDVASEQARNLR